MSNVTNERAERLANVLMEKMAKQGQPGEEILSVSEQGAVLFAISTHRQALAAEREADNSDRKREAYTIACDAVKDFFHELRPVIDALKKDLPNT